MHPLSEIISFGHLENKLMYPHINPGMELVLVEQGSLEWAVEGVPEILTPGTVFFTLPWQAHGSMHIREPRNKIYFILFELQEPYLQPAKKISMCKILGFSPNEQRMLSQAFTTAHRHAWPASALILQLFPELIQRLKSKNKLDARIALSLLRTVLLELANTMLCGTRSNPRLSTTAHRVDRLLKELVNKLDHPWTLDEMAETCGIKRTYFSNITRQLTGYAPLQYLNRLRFEKACTLLRDTDLPITEIGFICGYGSSQYFAETFKKYARLSPSDYRSNLDHFDTILRANWSHPEVRSISDELQRNREMGLE